MPIASTFSIDREGGCDGKLTHSEGQTSLEMRQHLMLLAGKLLFCYAHQK